MSQMWFYQFLDQTLGPVDFQSLQQLAQEGTIGPDDLVRTESGDGWQSARSVDGLIPRQADTDDIGAMLVGGDAPVAPSRRKRSSDCYYRGPAGVVGPIDFHELAALAEAGELQPATNVRVGADAEWLEAGAIVGLFPDGADQLGDFEIVAEQRTAAAGASGREWYCRVLRQQMGPFSFDQLFEMARDGQLAKTDEVRKGDGEWAPADSIVGLFPEEEPDAVLYESLEAGAGHYVAPQRQATARRKSSPDVRTGSESQTKTAKTPVGPAHSEPPDVDVPPDDRPEFERNRPATHTPDGAPERIPTPAPVRAPSTAASSPPPAWSSTRPLPPQRPPAPRPRKPMGNPFAGLTGSLGSLFQGVQINWKQVSVVAALLVVAAVIYGGLPFSNAGGAIYEETKLIWDRAQQLHKPETSDAEWQSFKAEVQPRVEELRAELEDSASAKQRLLQLMLYCHRDCLPSILSGGPQGAEGPWEEMQDYMNEANALTKK